MGAIRRQQYQHHKIGDQQSHVEGVGVIQALKSLIQEVLTDVLANAMRSKHYRQEL